LAFKRSFTDPVPQKQEDNYTAKGIATFHGEARFAGPNSVEIAGRALNARYMLIATGAAPVRLGIPGEEHVIDNAGPRISAICFEGKLSLKQGNGSHDSPIAGLSASSC